VLAHFTRAKDYGIVTAKCGDATSEPIDLYRPDVEPSGQVELFHRVKLKAGANPVTFTVTGKNEKSSNFYVGVDSFELRRPRPATTQQGAAAPRAR